MTHGALVVRRTISFELPETLEEVAGLRAAGREELHELDQPSGGLRADKVFDLATVHFRLGRGESENVRKECSECLPLGEDGIDDGETGRRKLDHVVVILQKQTAILERPQGNRNTAPGDIELLRDVSYPRPAAVLLADFVDGQQVVSGTVSQLIGVKFFPSFHGAFRYSTGVWYVKQFQMNGLT